MGIVDGGGGLLHGAEARIGAVADHRHQKGVAAGDAVAVENRLGLLAHNVGIDLLHAQQHVQHRCRLAHHLIGGMGCKLKVCIEVARYTYSNSEGQ